MNQIVKALKDKAVEAGNSKQWVLENLCKHAAFEIEGKQARITELEETLRSINFQATRATSSHDEDCLCATCEIKRLIAEKVTK